MKASSALMALGLVAVSVAPVAAATETAPAPSRTRAQIRVTTQGVGTPYELFGVSFPDSAHGYVTGAQGTILATVDAGATWQARQAPSLAATDTTDEATKEVIRDISFPDLLNGHAVGSRGSLLATDDGGLTWIAQQPPAPLKSGDNSVPWSFPAVSFADRDRGFTVGGQGALLTTSDGGATWETFADTRFGNLMDVVAVGGGTAQAVGWSGHVTDGIPYVSLATADGGRSWQPRSADFEPGIANLNFNAVAFPDAQHGFAVGDEGRIVATTDGGATWQLQRGGSAESFLGVAFADSRRGVVVGTDTFTTGEQKAFVFATDDGGLTWVSRIVDNTVRLRGGVDFADGSTAYAVGCRRDRPGIELDRPTCDEAALVRIEFFESVASSSDDGSSSPWVLMLIGLGAAAALAVVVIAVRSSTRTRA